MKNSETPQEQLTENIQELKKRISQLEEENLSQSSQISDLLRFKTISDSFRVRNSQNFRLILHWTRLYS